MSVDSIGKRVNYIYNWQLIKFFVEKLDIYIKCLKLNIKYLHIYFGNVIICKYAIAYASLKAKKILLLRKIKKQEVTISFSILQ